MVHIRLVGSLSRLTKKEQFTLNCGEKISLKKVIKKIGADQPTLKSYLKKSESGCGNNMLIFVNGQEISVLDGLTTIIKKEDELVFVPITHGG